MKIIGALMLCMGFLVGCGRHSGTSGGATIEGQIDLPFEDNNSRRELRWAPVRVYTRDTVDAARKRTAEKLEEAKSVGKKELAEIGAKKKELEQKQADVERALNAVNEEEKRIVHEFEHNTKRDEAATKVLKEKYDPLNIKEERLATLAGTYRSDIFELTKKEDRIKGNDNATPSFSLKEETLYNAPTREKLLIDIHSPLFTALNASTLHLVVLVLSDLYPSNDYSLSLSHLLELCEKKGQIHPKTLEECEGLLESAKKEIKGIGILRGNYFGHKVKYTYGELSGCP